MTLGRVVRKVLDCSVNVPILQNKEHIAKGTTLVADTSVQIEGADASEQPALKKKRTASVADTAAVQLEGPDASKQQTPKK